MKFELASVEIDEGFTEAPDYLTESDLIGLMEKHSIGTDASMASHIHNICERNFVSVCGQKRRLVPSSLGLCLINSYYEIDKELVTSDLRGKIEGWVNEIATGKRKFDDVIKEVVNIFKKKFIYFTENISKGDKIFSKSYKSFDDACVNAKMWTKCGQCRCYMKIVQNYNKLICEKCNRTYQLPKKAKYKSIEGKKCELDKFELFYALKEDENMVEHQFLFCPRCFHVNNYGEFSDEVLQPEEKEKKKTQILKDKEKYHELFGGIQNHVIKDCSACDTGKMLLLPGNNKTQSLVCNNFDECMFTIKLGEMIKSCVRLNTKCEKEECKAHNLKIMFDSKHETAPGF